MVLKNNNGHIEYNEVEHKLDEVHKGIAPDPKPHHLHHEDREHQRHFFLRSVIGTDKNRIPRELPPLLELSQDAKSLLWIRTRGWKKTINPT